jgi:8-oxo-dGTP pyrophosphatase MutT (NUDIX family)
MRAGHDQPTHAGGVVYRLRDGGPEFLLTTAKRRADQWVLPKGHIDPGENAEEAAAREVAEETGVTATVEGALDTCTIVVDGEEQRVLFFLMRFVDQRPADEGRSMLWLPGGQAEEQLTFDNLRRFISLASVRLTGDAGHPPRR